MQSFYRSFRAVEIPFTGSKIFHFKSSNGYPIGSVSGLIALEPSASETGRQTTSSFLQQPTNHSSGCLFPLLHKCISSTFMTSQAIFGFQSGSTTSHDIDVSSISQFYRCSWQGRFKWGTVGPTFYSRCMTTMGDSEESISSDGSASVPEVAPRIKFKRLDKTAKHIMQILDKEAVEVVRAKREIPDIKPGYIVQLKVEVPENKRRVSTLKGIVIARRNAGLNSTFRLRRLVAGVGVESVFPLYSPNIKEMKVLDKKKVRRAKLYYLRDKMNALKKQ